MYYGWFNYGLYDVGILEGMYWYMLGIVHLRVILYANDTKFFIVLNKRSPKILMDSLVTPLQAYF